MSKSFPSVGIEVVITLRVIVDRVAKRSVTLYSGKESEAVTSSSLRLTYLTSERTCNILFPNLKEEDR